MDTVLIGSTQEMVTCDCEREYNTLETYMDTVLIGSTQEMVTCDCEESRQYIGDLHGYSSHRFHTGDGDL